MSVPAVETAAIEVGRSGGQPNPSPNLTLGLHHFRGRKTQPFPNRRGRMGPVQPARTRARLASLQLETRDPERPCAGPRPWRRPGGIAGGRVAQGPSVRWQSENPAANRSRRLDTSLTPVPPFSITTGAEGRQQGRRSHRA